MERQKFDRAGPINIVVMVLVLAAHIVLILRLNRNSADSTSVNQSAIVLKLIAPEEKKVPIELPSQVLLNLNSSEPSVYLDVPDFSIVATAPREASSIAAKHQGGVEESQTTQSSSAGNTIFDPRLRQRLRQLEMNTKSSRDEALTTWTASSGRKYVDMGDGTCIYTMGKIDGERQAQWSSTRSRCGKSLGEKMLDNVQHNLNGKN